MYSETEALCKQCPEAPASGYTFALQNTSGGNLSGSLYATSTGVMCVASRCMAWRWADDMKTKGYCGKFGKPYPGE